MKERKVRVAIPVIIILAIVVTSFLLSTGSRRKGQSEAFISSQTTANASEITSWKEAAQKVVEDRGEPMGRQAKVEIPSQLRHYSDTRRFLAVQVAEWQKHRFQTPHDFAGLVKLIESGELVELQSVSSSYILYGVGGGASIEPFTHYYMATG